MDWFPWEPLLVGAFILVVLLLVMKRQRDSFGLGRTARFLIFTAAAAISLWAAGIFPGLDRYFARHFQYNALFRSFVPFFIVWAVANARNLKRRADGRPETLTTFAVKCGFASGLAGRLLFDAATNPYIRWPRQVPDRTWLVLNGLGLVIYLIVYLG